MKNWLCIIALLVMVAPLALADDATAADAEALAVETAEQPAPEVVLDDDGLPLSAVELYIRGASSGYECPPSTTYCQRSDQCDAFCGGPGFGVCQNGCCYCSL